MKLPIVTSAAFGLCVLLCSAVNGQNAFGRAALEEGYRMVEIGKALNSLPTSAKRPEDFVPAHWKVFARADGDLNRDGAIETVMVLQLNLDDKGYIGRLAGASEIESWGPDTYMILMVRPLPNKMLEFDTVNYEIGAMPQDERDGFTVEIKNGVLIVHTSTGGSLRNDDTWRFREDPPTGRSLTLIGHDSRSYPVTLQQDSVQYSVSENYLTGERIETTTTFNKQDKAVDAVKRSSFKPEKIEFSAARPSTSY